MACPFQKFSDKGGGGVCLFGVCAVKRRNTIYCYASLEKYKKLSVESFSYFILFLGSFNNYLRITDNTRKFPIND